MNDEVEEKFQKTEASRFSKEYPEVSGDLKDFPGISLQVVSGGALESFWDDLVHAHHYLGYKRLLGRRLKYMAFFNNRPLAALNWSAPSRKLQVRDDFIGWTGDTRRRFLHCLAANSRFVIFPWVRIPHLASHLLGRNLRLLKTDWQARFQVRLLLVETFVDPARFMGTAYRASNWQHLGTTKGYAKVGQGYRYHGQVKDVFVYVRPFEDLVQLRDIRHTLGFGQGEEFLVQGFVRHEHLVGGQTVVEWQRGVANFSRVEPLEAKSWNRPSKARFCISRRRSNERGAKNVFDAQSPLHLAHISKRLYFEPVDV